MPAARLLFSYLLGKPCAPVDPDKLDLHEWNKYRAEAGLLTGVPELVNQPAPDLALDVIRAAKPAVTARIAETLGAALAGPEGFERRRQEELYRRERELGGDPDAPYDPAEWGHVGPTANGVKRPESPWPKAPPAAGKPKRPGRPAPSASGENGPPPRPVFAEDVWLSRGGQAGAHCGVHGLHGDRPQGDNGRAKSPR